jgi:hypothetical protein
MGRPLEIAVLRGFRRWWTRAISLPARLLMRVASQGQPQEEYQDIRFMVSDREVMPRAEQFFEQTRVALQVAEQRAPHAYAELRKDLHQVLLWGQTKAMGYNRFQLAAVVSPKVALESNSACYAAWLLYTSGLLHGQDEAEERSGELMRSLRSDERDLVAGWLTRVLNAGRS